MNAKLAFAGLLLVAAGCGPVSRVTKPLANAAKPGKSSPRKSVAVLEDELAAAKEAESKAIEARKAKERELSDARIARVQRTLYWVVGICVFVAIGCVVLAFFLPAFRRFAVYGALGAVAVAGLAVVTAKLLPYLIWIGAVLLVGFVGLAIYYWRLDAKGRDQIFGAVETFKDKMPGYKEHFAKIIDTEIDDHLDAVRERLTKRYPSAQTYRPQSS